MPVSHSYVYYKEEAVSFLDLRKVGTGSKSTVKKKKGKKKSLKIRQEKEEKYREQVSFPLFRF